MSSRNKEVLTRRDALKTLTAATGAVALTNLPGKWETPLIDVGALPAHAAVSCGTPPIGEPGSLTVTVSWPEDPDNVAIVMFVFSSEGELGGIVGDVDGPLSITLPNQFVDELTGTWHVVVLYDFNPVGDPPITVPVTVTITTECGTSTLNRSVPRLDFQNMLLQPNAYIADVLFPGGLCEPRSGSFDFSNFNGNGVVGAFERHF